jgi:hypothetical protein
VNEIGPQERNAGAPMPTVYTDRRALSEAWYRALFESRLGELSGTQSCSRAQSNGSAAPRLPPVRSGGARADPPRTKRRRNSTARRAIGSRDVRAAEPSARARPAAIAGSAAGGP